jgi:hypothetical protein
MDKPLTVPLRFPFPAPTHNLTLSCAAREIVELDHKLHDAYPTLSRPALPIDPSALPQPAKCKSVILNTLSRLASPASKSAGACIFFACKADKSRHVLIEVGGAAAANLDFHAGSKDTAEPNIQPSQRRWRLSDEPIPANESDELADPDVHAQTRCNIFLGYTSNLISLALAKLFCTS